MSTATRRLQTARHIRHQIAHRFKLIESGELRIEDVLRDPDGVLKRVRIHDLIRRSPHMGSKGADHVCRRARVYPLVRLGELEEDARERLIKGLPPRARTTQSTLPRQDRPDT